MLWLSEVVTDHQGGTCADFDSFENENVVQVHRDVRDSSLQRIRERFDAPVRAETLVLL